MKKKSGIVIVTFSVLNTIILLSGCVSKSEFEALEKRVTELEQQNYTNRESQIENNNNQDNNLTEFTYSIDNLSAEEVVSECKYYYENSPKQGEKYENYFSCVKADPTYTSDDGLFDIYFRSLSPNTFANNDVITRILFSGLQQEMDGTIGYSGNTYYVEVDLIIQDYEKASTIYNQLYTIIVDENYTDIQDNRSSTYWSSYAMFCDTDNSAIGISFLEMTKEEDGFQIISRYMRRR